MRYFALASPRRMTRDGCRAMAGRSFRGSLGFADHADSCCRVQISAGLLLHTPVCSNATARLQPVQPGVCESSKIAKGGVRGRPTTEIRAKTILNSE